jgi:hypothetical protein
VKHGDLPQILLQVLPCQLLEYVRYLQGPCNRTAGTVSH